jgi:hypothetical protein
MALTQWQKKTLEVLIDRVDFKSADFGDMNCGQYPVTVSFSSSEEMDKYIKDKIRLYLDSWVRPYLRALHDDDKETCAYTQPWGRF